MRLMNIAVERFGIGSRIRAENPELKRAEIEIDRAIGWNDDVLEERERDAFREKQREQREVDEFVRGKKLGKLLY